MGVVGTKAAAARVGVSERRILAMIASGLLRATKIGRDWAIDENDLEKFVKTERKPGRPRKEP